MIYTCTLDHIGFSKDDLAQCTMKGCIKQIQVL